MSFQLIYTSRPMLRAAARPLLSYKDEGAQDLIPLVCIHRCAMKKTASPAWMFAPVALLAASAAVLAAENDYANLQPGSLAEPWRTGGPNCLTVPDWQVHEYNEDFYILRESGCINPEKPFLYLIFGDKKALLEDTGVGTLMPDNSRGTVIPTAPVIMDLMAKWAAKKNHAPLTSLVVIHSHGHNDHTAADPQFQAQSNVEYIAPIPDDIAKKTGMAGW